MRNTLIAGAAALAALASAATVQAQAADPHAGHAMPAAAAAAAKPSTATPIVDLMANPASKAVVDKALPELAAHPSYEMFKAMSLKDLAPMSEGVITEEVLTKIEAELAKLPAA